MLASLALAGADIQGAASDAIAQPLRAELLKWRSVPRATDFARLFPERATRSDREGAATVLCRLGPKNRLTDCTIQTETPDGYGFGKAATILGTLFELAPDQNDKREQEGASVLVKVRFNLPGHQH